VDLTLAVIAINGWNRLAIPFRAPAGSYTVQAGNESANVDDATSEAHGRTSRLPAL
jgi:hypothetical protein